MSPSEAVARCIRERAERLDQFSDRIMGCRVVVEARHRRHRQGNLDHLRIDPTAPGDETVVSREPALHQTHEDVSVAIRDAFDAARRCLEDSACGGTGGSSRPTRPRPAAGSSAWTP